MTKKQIELHKEVILWFVNNPDKGVWCRSDILSNLWRLQYEPVFHTASEYTYTQNDEYSEFRKAHVDGITIQYNPKRQSHDRWDDLDNADFCEDITHYRIKPKEPKFIKDRWYEYKSGHKCLGKDVSKYSGNKEPKLWEPKDGEYVCIEDFCFANIYAVFIYICETHNNRVVLPIEFILTLKDK